MTELLELKVQQEQLAQPVLQVLKAQLVLLVQQVQKVKKEK